MVSYKTMVSDYGKQIQWKILTVNRNEPTDRLSLRQAKVRGLVTPDLSVDSFPSRFPRVKHRYRLVQTEL
jgi:hypothetical protein